MPEVRDEYKRKHQNSDIFDKDESHALAPDYARYNHRRRGGYRYYNARWNGGRDYIVGMIKNMGSSVINISINSKETNASDYITAEDIKAIKNLDSVAYVSQVTMSVGNVTTK